MASKSAPPSSDALAGPRIQSLTAGPISCPDLLLLTWRATDAVRVEISIDTPTGVFDSGPPVGSMEVPAPCGGDTQTYYVTAVAAGGDRSTRILRLP